VVGLAAWYSQPSQHKRGADKVEQHPTLFEFEPGFLQAREGLSVQMAASTDSRPEWREKLVEPSWYAGSFDVLNQVKRRAGSSHSKNFLDDLGGVVHAAEHEGGHDMIEGVAFQWKFLCSTFQKSHSRRAERLGTTQHIRIGFDGCHDLGVSIEREIRPGSASHFKNRTGERFKQVRSGTSQGPLEGGHENVVTESVHASMWEGAQRTGDLERADSSAAATTSNARKPSSRFG